MCPIGRPSHKERTPEYVTANPPGTSAPPTMAGVMSHQSHLPGPAPNTAGPHRHDILNKLDPTVDSQSGGVQVLGPGVRPPVQQPGQGYTHGQATNVGYGMHHAGAPMQPGVDNGYGQPRHNSRLANALDPRVDTAAQGQGHTFPAGSQPTPMMTSANQGDVPQGTYGPHASRTANMMDPRVDSDLNGRAQMSANGQRRAARPGELMQPGPAPNTAGPHRSDIMNKLDPSVNSKASY